MSAADCQQAIEFLADPYAPARELLPDSDPVHFTLGYAKGIIGNLLDLLGYGENTPDKWTLWRMEWDRQHPAEVDEDELVEVSS